MKKETIIVGKRGTVIIPAKLRRKYSLAEGSLIIAESRPDVILLRPAVTLDYEKYTPERKAEFLLNTAVTDEDYRWAVNEIRKMNPGSIPHKKSRGRGKDPAA